MSSSEVCNTQHLDAEQQEFLEDVHNGLAGEPKSLPSKYLYDQAGSQLFDQICELPEYYPTRTELAIMKRNSAEIVETFGDTPLLIELGSGSSWKTRLLLDELPAGSTYVPVDISREHLHQTAEQINSDYPELDVNAVHADFMQPIPLPLSETGYSDKVVYFPGSTIGNFEQDAAEELLGRISDLVDSGGHLLIGLDLDKDRETLEAAYDDSAKVTAAFNFNLLKRINRELDADFDLSAFRYEARYCSDVGRVEMFLISQIDQTVTIGGEKFEFTANDEICTEHSHKYQISEFSKMAKKQGMTLQQTWLDDKKHFCVALYRVD